MKVGLHQGSALLFIIIMDVLGENSRTKPPWAMLFADDLVLVSETVEEVDDELERWRAVIENNVFSTQFEQIIFGSTKLCRPLTYRHANYQSNNLQRKKILF